MSHSVELEVGVSSPLGASVVGEGVNFAVYAPQAQHMSLCLFDSSGHSEILTLAMHMNEGGIWTLKVSPLKSGALYGFRADGEYAPEKGLFFNNHKLLLDPYARDLYGEFTWSERHYGQMPVGKLSQVNNAIDMPISEAVFDCVTGKKSVQESIDGLLGRPLPDQD